MPPVSRYYTHIPAHLSSYAFSFEVPKSAGGDEFLAVTHGLDREQMTQCLEKVRRDMREESKVYPDTPLSYAAGFALAGDFPGSTMRELFNCAEKTCISIRIM